MATKHHNLTPRLAAASLLLAALTCLFFAATNYWAYLRMRTLPVEAVRSSLVIDAGVYYPETPIELDYTLRLDLRATDGSGRTIHWEGPPAHAVYPEEAYDELARWAPGSSHVIYQLRGAAKELRLPGSAYDPERSVAFGFLFGAFFFGFIAVIFLGVLSEDDSLFRRLGLRRYLGVWLIFFLVGIGSFAGAALFVADELPKSLHWPRVIATLSPGPGPVPPGVTITPPARKHLDALPPHRILTFSHSDATIHGGLGSLDGAYDSLAAVCPITISSCQFQINPANRWQTEAKPAWNAAFLFPFGMFTLFGVAFTWVGLFLRRHMQHEV